MSLRIKYLPSITRAPSATTTCCCCGKPVGGGAPTLRLLSAMAAVHPDDEIHVADGAPSVEGRWHADHAPENCGPDLGRHAIARDCADRLGLDWVRLAA